VQDLGFGVQGPAQGNGKEPAAEETRERERERKRGRERDAEAEREIQRQRQRYKGREKEGRLDPTCGNWSSGLER